MTLSPRNSTSCSLAASIGAGARHFNWRRLAYLLAMAGAAGASIVLLLLAASTAYAAVPAAAVLPGPVLASEPSAMFEEVRDNFLVWSLLLGSVVLLGLVLPFLLSGLFALVTRVALYASVAVLLVAGALLIASTWLGAYLSSGAINLTAHRHSPRLSRVEAELRQALQLLMGRGIAR
ncbi:MAG TPA: hypothetical protein PKV98_01535 [Burkholderiaceae bacterium]|nr:hypothetical protein [Burkholderiaceae bacterium]